MMWFPYAAGQLPRVQAGLRLVRVGDWKETVMSQWYYAKQGQQVGPIDDQTMQGLLANGTVLPSELVWCGDPSPC